MFTYQTEIEGTPYTFYRLRIDQPYAEVMAQIGEFDASRRPDAWINTQYGQVNSTLSERLKVELVQAAREFQRQRMAAEKARDAAPIAAPSSAPKDAAQVWRGQDSMDHKDSHF